MHVCVVRTAQEHSELIAYLGSPVSLSFIYYMKVEPTALRGCINSLNL